MCGAVAKMIFSPPLQPLLNLMLRISNCENNMVMSRLINSLIPEIGETFLLYPIARAIWEAAHEMYSNSENSVELFGVESILHDLILGDATMTSYFNSLMRYWLQLDLFEVFD